MHFEYTSAPFVNCDAVIQRLKKFLPDYDKGKDYSYVLADRTQTAVNNARKIATPIDLYSTYTEVYKLAEFLDGPK